MAHGEQKKSESHAEEVQATLYAVLAKLERAGFAATSDTVLEVLDGLIADDIALDRVCKVLQEKVTDAPTVTRDNAAELVVGVISVASQVSARVQRLQTYCQTLHEFIQKGGV